MSKKIGGKLTADVIIDYMSIFTKTVYCIDDNYLDLSEFVGKTVMITIEEVQE
jgi:hypothetical protein